MSLLLRCVTRQRPILYRHAVPAAAVVRLFQSCIQPYTANNRRDNDDDDNDMSAQADRDNGLFTPEERERYRQISEWLAKFSREKIPYKSFEIAYMRSSGPGGQNVNKVSTKVDMRFPLDYAGWMPDPVREKLAVQEAARLNKQGELVITSDRTRSQKMNLEDCVDKLYAAIMQASELPKEPDAEQQAKVKRLKDAEKRRKREDKQRRSDKKSSRRSRNDD